MGNFPAFSEKLTDLLPFPLPLPRREFAEDEEERINKCCSAFKHHLVELNHHAHLAMNEDLRHAVDNLIANVRYHHIEDHGPRLTKVTEENPLVKWFVTSFKYSEQELTFIEPVCP